ncbi:MAG: hypothetical protein ACW99A_12705 [Candidatus Kariarchaeaceae archaeon]|jgi:hypothetical protein
MKSQEYYKNLFFFGAIWNIAAASSFILASKFVSDIYDWFGTHEPNNFVWYYNFFLLVIVFGIGYYWVSQDISQNHEIVKMGIIAKLGVVFLLTTYFILGEFNGLVLIPALIDFVFAVLYLEFLKNFTEP